MATINKMGQLYQIKSSDNKFDICSIGVLWFITKTTPEYNGAQKLL
jgi:hypothetical protein